MSETVIPLTDALVGTRVGEYEVLEPVGEGGMGVVYRGIQPVIKKQVAIKVLKPHVAGDAQQVRRLVAEAEAVNAIGHRGIIDIFGLGALPDGRPYIIMEYLEGEALDLWLAKQPGGRVSLAVALELLAEVCAPLAAAHRAGVIHRDLKPSNVFLCRQADGAQYLKLLDFGLAKRALGLDGSTKQTSQAVVAGTPDYMAPEQARGLAISARTDLYALGVLAFELLTGRMPFTGKTAMDVMVAHVSAPVPSVKALEPAVPDEVDALVQWLMRKAPEERPASADEVREVLERCLVALGGTPLAGGRAEAPLLAASRTSSPGVPRRSQPGQPGPAVVVPRPPTPPPPPVVVVKEPRWEEPPQAGPSLATLVTGAVALLLVGAGLTWLFTRPEAPRPPAQPTPVAVAPAEPPPAPAPGPEPVGAPAVTPAAAPVAPPGPEAAPPAVDAGVEVPRAPRRPAPTQQQLLERIQKLEARAKKRAGLDPSAFDFLKRYRVDVMAADAAPERLRVERKLAEWERTFLRK